MKNYEPTLRQSMAIREFVSEAITPLIEDVLVKKLGQAMAFLKEQESPKREWDGLTDEEILDCWKQAYEPGHREHMNAMNMARTVEAKLKEKCE